MVSERTVWEMPEEEEKQGKRGDRSVMRKNREEMKRGH